jgi:hypothetical protein
LKNTYVIIFILLNLNIKAQLTFQKIIGGANNDVGYSIQSTADGGYVIVGNTDSYGTGLKEVYLIKTNEGGDTIWTKTYGQMGSADEVGLFVQQTSDGGYIISGYTDLNDPTLETFILKTDSDGNVIWGTVFGSLGGGHSVGKCIRETSNGDFIVTGYKKGSFIPGNVSVSLNKISANGIYLWGEVILSVGIGLSINLTSDGGYIVTGHKELYGSGSSDVFLIKTDNLGNVLFAKSYGGVNDEKGTSVQQTSDGGYIVTGTTESFGNTGKDIYLIKTDSIGNTLWTRTLGGVNDEDGTSVHQTWDGGYIICGSTNSFGAGNYDTYLIKTDSAGETVWSRTFGSAGADYANSVKQTADRGFVLTGSKQEMDSDVYIIKTDSVGISGCNESTPVTVNSLVNSSNVSITSNAISSNNTIINVVPLLGNGGVTTTICYLADIAENSDETYIEIFPNPSNGNFNIKIDKHLQDASIKIFDILGKLIYSKQDIEINPDESIIIDLSGVNNGMFFLNITNNDYSGVLRIIKQ